METPGRGPPRKSPAATRPWFLYPGTRPDRPADTVERVVAFLGAAPRPGQAPMSLLADRTRRVHLGIGVSALALTEAGREWYRPWVKANGIEDFHVADTLGNSLGTVTAVFLIVGLVGKGGWSDLRLIGMVTLGLVGYELAQGPMGGAIDPRDILATLLAGVACLALYVGLNGLPARTGPREGGPPTG